MKIFIPNLRSLEIHLTYRCSLRCNNCSNLIGQAPAGAEWDFTAEDMDALMRQTYDLKYKWDKWTLHGGEPTLHPSFVTICDDLSWYAYRTKLVSKIVVATNGLTQATRLALQQVRGTQHIEIANSNKEQHAGNPGYTPEGHALINVSPTDEGMPYTLGCFQSSDCGIALNKAGYYPCSPMAAAARVFGYPPVAAELKGVTLEAMQEAFKTHCKHCGFARDPMVRGGVNQVTSPTWKEALEEYRKKE